MPRIHYPKGGGTSNARWPTCRRRLPRPAAVCPFITKAHETLTRRLGESVVSVSRVRRRSARHRPNGPEGTVPVAQGLPGSRPPPVRAVAWPFPKGSVRGALPEGAFSEVARTSRFLPAYRDTVNPQARASIPEAVRHPRTYVEVYRSASSLSTREPHPLGLFRDSSTRSPSPTTSQVVRDYAGPFRHPDDGAWLVQLSGPCSAL